MKIYVQENQFFIENLQVPEITLSNNESKKIFSLEQNRFVIKFEDLQGVLTEKNAPLTFTTNTNEDLIVPDDTHSFEKTFIKKGKITYFIYLTKDNKLCVILDKRPSLLNFHNKNAVYNKATVKDNKLILNFKFTCSIYQPTTIVGKIKVRNKNAEITTNGEIVEIHKNNNDYSVTANLIFDIQELETLFMEQVPFYTYNSDVYDISFNYRIAEMQISKYYVRLKFPLENKYNVDDEQWLALDDHFMLHCRPYPTLYGNLSMRLTPIPKETYNDYITNELVKLNNNGKLNIVCLEYPEKAQENGLIYFKWLVKNLAKDFNIYYMVSPDSKDLDNLTGYENHVIFYKSRENLALVNEVNVICHSHSAEYLLPILTNKTERYIKQKNRVFLQHGIIGSKDVSGVYGRKPNDSITDLFVVSSEREKEVIYQNYGFDKNEIIITGLPRFDDVIKERRNIVKKIKNRHKILIMPTWRKGLNTYTDEKFMETAYYKEFQQLINNDEIKTLVKEKGYQIALYLHRNFQGFKHLFTSENVEVLSDQEHTVKDLLAEYQVLVTDYSSVGLDFALMHKKVIYYRPENILGEDFISESTDLLPGNVVNNQQQLIYHFKNTAMIKKYKNNLDKLYKYADRKACARIAENMISHFKLFDQ
ncbi:CDP-glycerol glycerophosphotransferase family protein [Staphylococcus sp. 18_1_E_LY]|uniref:CDP-glycerol glycerophosphotransferase family protein n=1 Tax=Staphylococcus lloydii TaxID=2781774 RepID=A0A7T1F9B4_9STAP|nr:CDP-glycerol glycerophosphotransferase family protein [Staphylococcus lloydii]MBF7019188.1 CDP-glycerol glycerophosphotransferase family protein [Staphylococcus lloydii]MBF7026916.1 CDP-glycerol glycerophosphotransferase family protein [Staphylococcus lloydii]QPM74566.1 CDP-glycerol glycerophosphotransferase family protein [Staphylococcus lloydii]